VALLAAFNRPAIFLVLTAAFPNPVLLVLQPIQLALQRLLLVFAIFLARQVPFAVCLACPVHKGSATVIYIGCTELSFTPSSGSTGRR
jgi:hypothetical protein